MYKFLELFSQNKLNLNQQKLDLLLIKKKEKQLQHESSVGYVDTDETVY